MGSTPAGRANQSKGLQRCRPFPFVGGWCRASFSACATAVGTGETSDTVPILGAVGRAFPSAAPIGWPAVSSSTHLLDPIDLTAGAVHDSGLARKTTEERRSCAGPADVERFLLACRICMSTTPRSSLSSNLHSGPSMPTDTRPRKPTDAGPSSGMTMDGTGSGSAGGPTIGRTRTGRRSFNLTRWFSLLSFACIGTVSVVSSILLSRFLTDNLLERDANILMDVVQSIAEVQDTSAYFLGSSTGARDHGLEEFFVHVAQAARRAPHQHLCAGSTGHLVERPRAHRQVPGTQPRARGGARRQGHRRVRGDRRERRSKAGASAPAQRGAALRRELSAGARAAGGPVSGWSRSTGYPWRSSRPSLKACA